LGHVGAIEPRKRDFHEDLGRGFQKPGMLIEERGRPEAKRSPLRRSIV
jgi:hypothetical protein